MDSFGRYTLSNHTTDRACGILNSAAPNNHIDPCHPLPTSYIVIYCIPFDTFAGVFTLFIWVLFYCPLSFTSIPLIPLSTSATFIDCLFWCVHFCIWTTWTIFILWSYSLVYSFLHLHLAVVVMMMTEMLLVLLDYCFKVLTSFLRLLLILLSFLSDRIVSLSRICLYCNLPASLQELHPSWDSF